jgi:hypothetical protein
VWRWLAVTAVGCSFHPGGAGERPDARVDGDGAIITDDGMPDAPGVTVPITYVQGHTTIGPGSATSIQSTYADLPQLAGDLNVVVLSWTNSATIASVTDDSLNTYVSLGTASTNGLTHALFYAANIAARANNTVTIAFNTAATSADLRMVEYSGIATTSPVDITQIGTGASATTASGLATTTHAHDLILGANTVWGTTTGAGPLFTSRMILQGDIIEDRVVTTTGSYEAIAPKDTAEGWVMQLVAFKGVQ